MFSSRNYEDTEDSVRRLSNEVEELAAEDDLYRIAIRALVIKPLAESLARIFGGEELTKEDLIVKGLLDEAGAVIPGRGERVE